MERKDRRLAAGREEEDRGVVAAGLRLAAAGREEEKKMREGLCATLVREEEGRKNIFFSFLFFLFKLSIKIYIYI